MDFGTKKIYIKKKQRGEEKDGYGLEIINKI